MKKTVAFIAAVMVCLGTAGSFNNAFVSNTEMVSVSAEESENLFRINEFPTTSREINHEEISIMFKKQNKKEGFIFSSYAEYSAFMEKLLRGSYLEEMTEKYDEDFFSRYDLCINAYTDDIGGNTHKIKSADIADGVMTVGFSAVVNVSDFPVCNTVFLGFMQVAVAKDDSPKKVVWENENENLSDKDIIIRTDEYTTLKNAKEYVQYLAGKDQIADKEYMVLSADELSDLLSKFMTEEGSADMLNRYDEEFFSKYILFLKLYHSDFGTGVYNINAASCKNGVLNLSYTEKIRSEKCETEYFGFMEAAVPNGLFVFGKAWWNREVKIDEETQITYGDMYGDIDADGNIDLSDLTMFSQYLLKDITLEENQLQAADCNGDGTADITDIALLKQYIMHDNVMLGPV